MVSESSHPNLDVEDLAFSVHIENVGFHATLTITPHHLNGKGTRVNRQELTSRGGMSVAVEEGQDAVNAIVRIGSVVVL